MSKQNEFENLPLNDEMVNNDETVNNEIEQNTVFTENVSDSSDGTSFVTDDGTPKKKGKLKRILLYILIAFLC